MGKTNETINFSFFFFFCRNAEKQCDYGGWKGLKELGRQGGGGVGWGGAGVVCPAGTWTVPVMTL